MYKLGFYLIGATALFAAACDDDDVDDIDDIDDIRDEDPFDTDELPPAPTFVEWGANLTPTDPTCQLAGSASVTSTTGSGFLDASISISNDHPGALRPWHVHVGSCGQGGAIVGLDSEYPRLAIGADGVGAATVRVAADLDPNLAYSVNVHESDALLNTIIACGNLSPVTVQ
jgi:Cu-Zn family superoxide dismutase